MPDEKPATQPETEKPTAPASQEPAPEKKAPETPAPQVEAGAKPPADGKSREIQGLKTDLFKARSKARNAENDAAAKLEARLAALEQSLAEPSRAKPDNWTENQTGEESGVDASRLEKRIVNAVESRLNQREAEAQLSVAKAQANNWLLSREHLRSDPNAVNEMAEILEIPYFQELKNKYPSAAAREAYTYWCEQRGVVPDIGRVNAETPTSGAKPAGGKKADETVVDASILKGIPYGSPEYTARVKELEQAVREGKYKGKVIKL